MPQNPKGFLEVPLVIFVFLSFAFGTYVVLTKPTIQINTPDSNSSSQTNTTPSNNTSDQTDNSWWDAIANLFVYQEENNQSQISPIIINLISTPKPTLVHNPNGTDTNPDDGIYDDFGSNVEPTLQEPSATPTEFQLPNDFLEPMHEPSEPPNNNQNQETSFTPINPDQFEDNASFQYSIFDPNGGVLSTEFADGTKVYLVYPIDSFILPTLVTLTTITKSPFSDYIPHNRFHGVSIGPADSTTTPQRPAYLVFDLNQNRPMITKPNTASASDLP